jgi:serine O-acetyltransferase
MGGGHRYSMDLANYTMKQIDHFFPDGERNDAVKIKEVFIKAQERALYCFDHTVAYRNHGGKINFLHGDQYAMFLYFLSNEAYQTGFQNLYYKSALLNKCLHGIDLFGHINMPSVFLLVHPVGTIIGRATMGERIVIYQGVTIGGKHTAEGIDYPIIDNDVCLFSNTSVIGKCRLANGTVVAANTSIIDLASRPNTLVVGSYPVNKTKALYSDMSRQFFV